LLAFNARMTPTLANVVGPPSSAARISASMVGLPFPARVLGFRQLPDVAGRIPQRESRRAIRKRYLDREEDQSNNIYSGNDLGCSAPTQQPIPGCLSGTSDVALAADNGIYKEGAAAPEWRPPYRDAYAFNGKKSVLLKTF
jgi:hypothetical protein